MSKKEYTNYGTFKVTTEGDCEGRSTKDLGVHTGYIDEIAFALADKCYYTLCFKLVEPKSLDLTPKRDTVKISLDVDSGVWDLSATQAKDYYEHLFADRNVEVVDTHGWGSCTISARKEIVEQRSNESVTVKEEVVKHPADEGTDKLLDEIIKCGNSLLCSKHASADDVVDLIQSQVCEHSKS